MIQRCELSLRGAACDVFFEEGKFVRLKVRSLLPLAGRAGDAKTAEESLFSAKKRTSAPEPKREPIRLVSASPSKGYLGIDFVLSDGRTGSVSDGDRLLDPSENAPQQTGGKWIATSAIIHIGCLLTIDPSASAGQRLGEQNSNSEQGLAIAIDRDRIVWIGPTDELIDAVTLSENAHVIDARGQLVTPGLVEPHAHPLFAGDRAGEFRARAAGATYSEIAASGGGIASTVKLTRLASDSALISESLPRCERLANWGVTTAEAKSGYALEVDGELRMLERICELDALGPIELVPTLLAAHAFPPGSAADPAARAAWVSACANELPERAVSQQLAESCDVFCESGAFTLEETRAVLEGAQRQGLALRVHADQLSSFGASLLAAEFGALTCDHLEHLPDSAIAKLAAANTIAVLLPGAALNIRQPLPPARKLIDGGVRVALGTDLNPGSSMSEALPITMWLACTAMQMSVEESWLAVTAHSADACMRPSAGRIRVGGPADIVVWSCSAPEFVPYHYGENHARVVLKAGRVIATR